MYKIFLLLTCFAMASLNGAYVLSNKGLTNARLCATYSCEEHYSRACEAFEKGDYETAQMNFGIVCINFSNCQMGTDSAFFSGVCLYELGELDLANDAFSDYLKRQSSPRYFQETMAFKFCIANDFRCGAKRRFFGTKQLPKWCSANTLCLKIYDEVIQSIPCHEFAAQSLYAKGYMLWLRGEYEDSIDCFQTLIRRFPKHELAPDSYLAINRVYIEQCEWEFQNPDLLQLAEINCRRFKSDYPRDERCALAQDDFQLLKETYACGLYKTGIFYEKQCENNAASIYYKSAIKQFPDTEIAEKCRFRLSQIEACPDECNDDCEAA